MPWIADELVFRYQKKQLSFYCVFLQDKTCNQPQRLMESSLHIQTELK